MLREIVFEINEKEYEFAVCRDGMFLIRIPSLEKEIDKELKDLERDISSPLKKTKFAWTYYLKLANSIFLFLDSTLHGHGRNIYLVEVREITKMFAYRVTIENNIPRSAVDYGITSLGTLLRHGYINQIKYDAFYLENRFHLHTSILEDLNNLYLKVFFNNLDLKDYFEITAKSLSELNLGNNSISLILSWSLVERYIHNLWDSASNSKLMNDKPQSIFWLIEELKSWNILDKNDADTIHRFRKKRNQIIHNSREIDFIVAKECLDFIKIIITKETKFDLYYNTNGPALHGM